MNTIYTISTGRDHLGMGRHLSSHLGGHANGESSLLHTVQHCEATCEHMVSHLIQSHHNDSRDIQLQLLRDCADICTLMAKYLGRNSHFSKMLAHVCARICEHCGNECARFPDQMSQHCAQICLHCAKACNAFAAS